MNLVLVSPNLACFVLITITPFEPLFPYSEVADASFKTVKDSISFGLIERKLSLFDGKPSITYKGSEFPVIDPTPLMITVDFAPGCPVLAEIFTPANCPWIVLITLALGLFPIVSEETEAIDVTAFFFVTLRYPCEIKTSCNLTPSCNFTFTVLEAPTLAVVSVIPTKEKTKTSPAFALIEYFPSTSVCVPVFEP